MTEANRSKAAMIRQIMSETMRQIMTKGFHGHASVTIKVMDGTVQQVFQDVERMHR